VKKKKKKTQEKFIKDIDVLEKELNAELEIRKLVKPTFPKIGLEKTAKFFKDTFDYVFEIEEFITRDFFFDWLPRKIKKYIKLILPFSIMALILYIPFEINPEIKKAIALFICISLLWALDSLSMIVTALLIPVLAVALGLIKNSNPFYSFSNPIIYLLLSGLILGQAFRKHKLDTFLALKVISLSKGEIKRLLFYNMLITGLLGMWMSNTATLALMIPVILSISEEIHKKTEKNYTGMLLLSSGFGGAILGLSTILGGNPNAIAAAFLKNSIEFTFIDWTIIGFPIAVILFIVTYFAFVKIYNVKDEQINIDKLIKEAKQIKLNESQQKVILIFLPTVFLWVFGKEISHLFRLPIAFYRTEVIGLSSAIMLFALRVLEWDDVRRIPWEVFLLLGGGLTLGQIIIDTGSASFMAEKLFSLFKYLPNYFILLIIVLLSIVLANFVNNSSTTIILVPVLINLASRVDINQRLLVMGAAMATAISALTPIAIPSFSLIYGTGQVSRKEMVKTGITIASLCGLILTALLYIINRFFL
jgi:sodium-dependent dicarboxylate transporter 2/3/5